MLIMSQHGKIVLKEETITKYRIDCIDDKYKERKRRKGNRVRRGISSGNFAAGGISSN